MTPKILLFEDKLGITSGYESIWQSILLQARLVDVRILRRNSYSYFGNRVPLLSRKGNRKQPGFNPDPRVQNLITRWIENECEQVLPTICICMDPALMFLANPDWDQATGDNLRGGNYRIMGRPWVFTLPISAWHRKKSEKDIAKLNEGYVDKEEWEEDHGGDSQDTEQAGAIWMEPVTVPEGRFVLRADIAKAGRVLRKEIELIERLERGELDEIA